MLSQNTKDMIECYRLLHEDSVAWNNALAELKRDRDLRKLKRLKSIAKENPKEI